MLKMVAKFKRVFNEDYATQILEKDYHDLMENEVQVGSYIQGQIIVSFCIGILLFIGYSIIGLDYGLVLACIVVVT